DCEWRSVAVSFWSGGESIKGTPQFAQNRLPGRFVLPHTLQVVAPLDEAVLAPSSESASRAKRCTASTAAATDSSPGGERRRSFFSRLRNSSTVRSWPGSDRKSTRLNSSHVSNSYAVFC